MRIAASVHTDDVVVLNRGRFGNFDEQKVKREGLQQSDDDDKVSLQSRTTDSDRDRDKDKDKISAER